MHCFFSSLAPFLVESWPRIASFSLVASSTPTSLLPSVVGTMALEPLKVTDELVSLSVVTQV